MDLSAVSAVCPRVALLTEAKGRTGLTIGHYPTELVDSSDIPASHHTGVA